MKLKDLKKSEDLTSNMLIKVGNFGMSIVRDGHQVMLFSLITDKAIKLNKCKSNKKLKQLKKEFKSWLCCNEEFWFERLSKDQIFKMINIIK